MSPHGQVPPSCQFLLRNMLRLEGWNSPHTSNCDLGLTYLETRRCVRCPRAPLIKPSYLSCCFCRVVPLAPLSPEGGAGAEGAERRGAGGTCAPCAAGAPPPDAGEGALDDSYGQCHVSLNYDILNIQFYFGSTITMVKIH